MFYIFYSAVIIFDIDFLYSLWYTMKKQKERFMQERGGSND